MSSQYLQKLFRNSILKPKKNGSTLHKVRHRRKKLNTGLQSVEICCKIEITKKTKSYSAVAQGRA